MQLNQLNHKNTPENLSATLIYGNYFKPVHYLVEHETVLSSQKDDCHPSLADFRNDQFSIGNIDKGENIEIEPLNSFSLEAVKPFQSRFKKPIRKITKILSQQPTFSTVTDLTDIDDPSKKR